MTQHSDSTLEPGPENTRSPDTRVRALLRVQLHHEVLVDVRKDFISIRKLLERAGELLLIDLDPIRESDLPLDLKGGLDAQLLLRFLAHGDDIACLALIRRNADRNAIHRDALMAHELARLVTSRGKTHPVDDVIEATFQHLQQVRTGRARASRSFDVVVAELTLEHAVHTTKLLLFAQLQAVIRQATASLALDTARRHFELALRFERLHTALQEQVRAFAARQLALGT